MPKVRFRQTSYIGMRVNKALYNSYGVLLIPASSILRKKDIDMLHAQKVVLEPEDVEESRILPLVSEAIDEMKEVFQVARQSGQIPLAIIRDRLIPIAEELTHCSDLGQVLTYLEQNDECTFRHSVGVALLARLIGKGRGMDESMLNDLTGAGFLHDIGKARIPLSILQKTGALTKREFEWIKLHPQYGYDMVKKAEGISKGRALAILQHHERMDGSGYPDGLTGPQIHEFGKIVAIADVFHAMISKRSYKQALPFYQVLQEMDSQAYGKLDPALTLLFMDKLMQTLIGNRVVLSNGGEAKIICVKPDDPVHPIVESNGSFIDLAKTRSLSLVSLL